MKVEIFRLKSMLHLGTNRAFLCKRRVPFNLFMIQFLISSVELKMNGLFITCDFE